MESVNKLSKGSSLQVMEKDKEKTTSDLQTKLEAAESERQIIKKNYESQLNMMSE